MSSNKGRRVAKRRRQERNAAQQQVATVEGPTSSPAGTADMTAVDSGRGSNEPGSDRVVLSCAGGVTISDVTYASVAEDLMDPSKGVAPFAGLTTTKLRGIYALIMNVYVRVNSEEEFERHKSDIQYLKVRMAYEAGREDAVKAFLAATCLRRLVDDIASFRQFRLYCRYAEALVAYFKFFGGKDS